MIKESEKIYNEAKPIIKAMTAKIVHLSALPMDEVKSEANFIFCECINKYNPKIGTFNKYLMSNLYWGLYTYVKKRKNQLEELTDFSFEEKDERLIDYRISDIINVTYENLSRDARKVVELVFDIAPNFTGKKKIHKEGLKRELYKEGWSKGKCEKVFNEIALAIQ